MRRGDERRGARSDPIRSAQITRPLDSDSSLLLCCASSRDALSAPLLSSPLHCIFCAVPCRSSSSVLREESLSLRDSCSSHSLLLERRVSKRSEEKRKRRERRLA